MSRLRISLLGLVAVCLASMFTTAAASAAGPFWHVNGAKLKQGSVGVKLQNKGPLSLKSTVSTLEVVITCGRSTSNATIDGQGETKQGQGKGLVKYEQCVTKGGPSGVCTKPETITTNQLKTHLALGLLQGKEQIVELFEPSVGTTFVTVPAFGTCSGTATPLLGVSPPVRGKVAAGVVPQEAEGQEGSLLFPSEEVINKVKHEGQEVKVNLTLGETENEAKFTGWYGARVQSGTFGVFKE